jgi:hypothetical protein
MEFSRKLNFSNEKGYYFVCWYKLVFTSISV